MTESLPKKNVIKNLLHSSVEQKRIFLEKHIFYLRNLKKCLKMKVNFISFE